MCKELTEAYFCTVCSTINQWGQRHDMQKNLVPGILLFASTAKELVKAAV